MLRPKEKKAWTPEKGVDAIKRVQEGEFVGRAEELLAELASRGITAKTETKVLHTLVLACRVKLGRQRRTLNVIQQEVIEDVCKFL